MVLLVLGEGGVPLRLDTFEVLRSLGVRLLHVVLHVERLGRIQPELGLELTQIVRLERSAVHRMAALLEAAVSDERLDTDDGGLIALPPGIVHGGAERSQPVRDVVHLLDVPPVRLVSLVDILGEAEGGGTVDGDVVVVVQDNELAQPQMTREAGRLGRDALLEASVAADHVGVVIEEGGGVGGREVTLGDGEADGVGDALAERASGHFHAIRAKILWMSGCFAPQFPKFPQIVHRRPLVSRQM
mmetsp:Transcript_37023/g.110873  ORF Transcript_37023/g.110873 Transcript_37023/m.110873 type:complete len:244 (-) Transcript_37023:697-1428(-)